MDAVDATDMLGSSTRFLTRKVAGCSHLFAVSGSHCPVTLLLTYQNDHFRLQRIVDSRNILRGCSISLATLPNKTKKQSFRDRSAPLANEQILQSQRSLGHPLLQQDSSYMTVTESVHIIERHIFLTTAIVTFHDRSQSMRRLSSTIEILKSAVR